MGFIGDAWDWTKDTASDIWDGAKDTFSGDDVSGPTAGSWGQTGTEASAYNQNQNDLGQMSRQRAMDQGGEAKGVGYNNAQSAGQRQAPGTDWGRADFMGAQGQQARGGTQQSIGALNDFAANSGQGPSAAQAQLQSATNQNNSNALALARSGRGFGGNAAAMGQAQNTLASNQANAANQSSALRAQEYQQAQQNKLSALNSALGGNSAMRGQDLASQQNEQGRAQFDVQKQLQQQQNDAAGLGWFNAGNQANLGWNTLGENTALQRSQLGQNAMNAQADYELKQHEMEQQAKLANQAADTQHDAAVLGSVSSIAGATFGAAKSDEHSKMGLRHLQERDKALSNALATVGNAPGYSYKYKNPDEPGTKRGRQVGIIAQDLEKGPLGDTLVLDTPSGKMVDTGRLSMVNSAAITALNRRANALERALGKGA